MSTVRKIWAWLCYDIALYLIDLVLQRCEEAFPLFILPLKAGKDQGEERLLTQKRHTAKEVVTVRENGLPRPLPRPA